MNPFIRANLFAASGCFALAAAVLLDALPTDPTWIGWIALGMGAMALLNAAGSTKPR